MQPTNPTMNHKVAVVEPFNGGSHRELVNLIQQELPDIALQCGIGNVSVDTFTLPAKKWHWKLRAAALQFSQTLPAADAYTVLFVSSMLNLAELCALRPDWSATRIHKVIYFHENQLVYPVQARHYQLNTNKLDGSKTDQDKGKRDGNKRDQDFQFGYNQVLSCLVADAVVFNSQYNMESFLNAVGPHLNKIPNLKINAKKVVADIRKKTSVLFFAINLRPLRDVQESIAQENRSKSCDRPLHIVWPHRWEHDKGPDLFIKTLLRLHETGADFKVSLLGEAFDVLPPENIRNVLGDKVVDWGFKPSKKDYLRVLAEADVVVSTALHEFFGVAMLEATFLGCYPLVPKRLAYPELYSKENIYSTDQQLYKRLLHMCRAPKYVRSTHPKNTVQDVNNTVQHGKMKVQDGGAKMQDGGARMHDVDTKGNTVHDTSTVQNNDVAQDIDTVEDGGTKMQHGGAQMQDGDTKGSTVHDMGTVHDTNTVQNSDVVQNNTTVQDGDVTMQLGDTNMQHGDSKIRNCCPVAVVDWAPLEWDVVLGRRYVSTLFPSCFESNIAATSTSHGSKRSRCSSI